MKRVASVSAAVLFALALVGGCRGSVDRVYDDALGGEGGPSAEAGASDGPIVKEHSDASDDAAPPSTAPAVITVSVLGVKGAGLSLQNNGKDDLAIPSEGAYRFTTLVPPGQPYKVTISNQPSGPSQTCTVANGEGTAVGKDIDNVKVTCATATFPVGGNVVGLDPTKTVTLQNNAGNDVVVTGSGPFTFPGVSSGQTFAVTIKSSTPGTTCSVSGGAGTIGTAAVDGVVVNCDADKHTIGGMVSGLVGTVVLTNNDGNDRTVTSNSYAFSLPVATDATYNVKVKTQPAYPPQTQVCTVANATGKVGVVDVTNVNVSCTTTKFTVGGTVNGLVGANLKLQNKGTDDKSINAPGGAFTFATQIPSGTSYNVTVVTQPAGQTCTVTNPSGTVSTATISNVVVNCSVPVALSENFDGVTDPTLPATWTSVQLRQPGPGAGAAVGIKWTTASDPGTHKSGANSAFIEDITVPRDVALVSPAFNVSSATAKLTFWHHYYTEGDWDGGVLEISIAGADWLDILDAGGSFNTNGYNGTLKDDGSSTLGGRKAWSGGPKTVDVSVNLPAVAAGKSVQLRWRWASDEGDSEDGWWIDDVLVMN